MSEKFTGKRSALWPTPTAGDATRGGVEAGKRRWKKYKTMPLAVAVKVRPPAATASNPLTSSVAGFPALTSPVPGSKAASGPNGQVFGGKCSASLGSFDPDTFSPKTWQPSLLDPNGLVPWSGAFPTSGIAWNGQFYRLSNVARPICGEGSLSWPTPTQHDSKNSRGPSEYERNSLTLNAAVNAPKREATFPTPQAMDAAQAQGTFGMNSGGNVKKWGGVNSLSGMAQTGLWPTPLSGVGPNSHNQISGSFRSAMAKCGVVGQLNPDWVEWLMGLPLGWTRLAGDLAPFPGWHEEPAGIPRVTTERENRVPRLRALGNAVVPQCAAFVGERILQHAAAA